MVFDHVEDNVKTGDQWTPMTSATRLKARSRTRRTSSLGKIDLGDSVPGLGTMPKTKESKDASQRRRRALSQTSRSEKDRLWKLWLSYRELIYRHFWVNPLIILVLTYLKYFTSPNRDETNFLHQFITISYRLDDKDSYGKGIKDLAFVAFYMIFFTFLREFLMDAVIHPITVRLNVTSKHRRKRIMEQVYSIIYYGISSPAGLYIMYNSDLWLFETKPMYRTYPDLNNTFSYKMYYLLQAAFWAQQACILVLQLEKPRKDHRELVFHHIVTLLLIWLSYVFHFTKIGLAIYITMDVSDFLLACSKTANYFDSILTTPIFLVFVASWVYLRHYINLKILWSLLTEFRTEGDYILNFATQQYKCWISLPIVFSLIFALHLLNIYWLFLVMRILYRILWQGIQKDERSESESEDDDDDDDDDEDNVDEEN